jgi:hypothetical protein
MLPKSQYRQMLTQLSNLSPRQLEEVKARLSLLLQQSSGLNSSSSWLVDGIFFELKRRKLIIDVMLAKQIRSFAPRYMQDAVMVEEWLQKELKRSVSPPQLMLLGRAAAEALAGYLCDCSEWQLSSRLMFCNLTKVPEAMDASFPGYVSAGLLSWLCDAK